MDLTEAREIVSQAVEQASAAQRTNTDFVIEGLRVAFEGADRLRRLGPVSGEEPFKLHVIAQRAESMGQIVLSIGAGMQVASEASQRVAHLCEEAIATLGPVVAEGWPVAADASNELQQAIEIVGGLFEPDDILPIIGETTEFRIGRAIGKMTALIAMLS